MRRGKIGCRAVERHESIDFCRRNCGQRGHGAGRRRLVEQLDGNGEWRADPARLTA